jgi:hypothetical protein
MAMKVKKFIIIIISDLLTHYLNVYQLLENANDDYWLFFYCKSNIANICQCQLGMIKRQRLSKNMLESNLSTNFNNFLNIDKEKYVLNQMCFRKGRKIKKQEN